MSLCDARAAALGGAILVIALAAGCAPRARIRYAVGGPDETVKYDSATFQLARDEHVQVVLFRRTAAPFGDPDPDFELVYFELPERRRYGWLREDGVPAYRWVRQNKVDRVWLGSAGRVRIRFGIYKRHLHLKFDVTMEPVAGATEAVHILSGNVKCPEDMVRTQGLLNRYGEWLRSLTKPREKKDAEK